RRPPGLILYFAGLERLLSAAPSAAEAIADALFRYRCEYWPLLYASDAEFAAAAGNFLTLALNAAALWPFFAAAQTLIGRRAALAAALFSPLVPGYVMWAGIWDQAMVLITAVLMWLLVQALVRRRHGAWPLMGVLISFGSFLTYVFLPLAGFVGLCAALEVWRERAYWRGHAAQLALNAVGFGVGLASLWIVYWLLSGVTFFEIYRATTVGHFAMSTTYGSRLFYNPYDFAFYLGFPVGLLALIAAFKVARAFVQRQPLSTAHSFAVSAFVMIAALTLFNVSRAEVGRVWVPYMPLIVLAVFALEGGPAQSAGRWAVTASLVAAQLIVMLSVFVGEGYPPYPHTIPVDSLPVSAQIGDSIALAGYNAPSALRPGDSLSLKLHWQTLRPPAGQFITFVHLYSAELGLAAQHDGPPRWGQYPTRCWQAGEVITDEITLTVDPNAPSGVYDLIVGMYDPARNNERLPVSGPNVRDLSIVLTQIEVK
ncbi:MAG TPA: hypothetical protein VI547_10955, partial [Anaerolineales bacterium]|nr:hypothetical protein [Anaerolineales bacterium]